MPRKMNQIAVNYSCNQVSPGLSGANVPARDSLNDRRRILLVPYRVSTNSSFSLSLLEKENLYFTFFRVRGGSRAEFGRLGRDRVSQGRCQVPFLPGARRERESKCHNNLSRSLPPKNWRSSTRVKCTLDFCLNQLYRLLVEKIREFLGGERVEKSSL